MVHRSSPTPPSVDDGPPASTGGGTGESPHAADSWRVALVGLLALALAMGIGRFAFTPVLPMMLRDGGITLPAAGLLATANYIGYLIGAVTGMYLRGTPQRWMTIGLVATAVLTACMGTAAGGASLLWWGVARFLAGITSAWVLVHASSWCLQRLHQMGALHLGGVMYAGPGVGIVVTGLAASWMLGAGWSALAGWWVMAGLAVLCILGIRLAMPPLAEPVHTDAAASAPASLRDGLPREPREAWLALAYGLSGFGYIITATYLPVIARGHLPDSAWPDLFWPIFGLSIVVGALLSVRLPLTVDVRWWLAGAYILQAGGLLLSVGMPTVWGFALGSAMMGLPFTAITLFALREARRLRPLQPAPLIGAVTAVFALGQVAGPPLATALLAGTGSFAPSLSLAAAALVAGSVIWTLLALLDRSPR